jgi:hypothetical protein
MTKTAETSPMGNSEPKSDLDAHKACGSKKNPPVGGRLTCLVRFYVKIYRETCLSLARLLQYQWCRRATLTPSTSRKLNSDTDLLFETGFDNGRRLLWSSRFIRNVIKFDHRPATKLDLVQRAKTEGRSTRPRPSSTNSKGVPRRGVPYRARAN